MRTYKDSEPSCLMPFSSTDPHELALAVHRDSLTYLSPNALNELIDTVEYYENAALPGCIVEAGCAAGGSAIVLAASKTSTRKLFLYDVFSRIPPPSTEDGPDVQKRYAVIAAGQAGGIGDKPYYGYIPNLLETVKSNFRKYGLNPDQLNVQFESGLYSETLFPQEPILLAHLDCDWYESVRCCLQRIDPFLLPGGAFILDDYHVWSGCRKAVDEYFADKLDRYQFLDRSRRHIIKIR